MDEARGAQGEPIDLRAYARPVWRRKWLVLATIVVAAAVTYGLTVRMHKTYTAKTRIYIQNGNPVASITSTQAAGPPNQQTLQDIANLVTAQTNTVAVYRQLHMAVGSGGSVRVTPETTSSFVDVTASSQSPRFAARLANTYVQTFLDSQAASVAAAARGDAAAAAASLHAVPVTGAANQAQRSALLAEIAQYNTIARNPSSGAQQVDPASVPGSPSSPTPARNTLIAGLLGLVLGVGLALILELLDRRLVRVSSVQSVYDRAVLAVLPHVSKADQSTNGSAATPTEFVEVMRGLRVNLRLAGGALPPKSILVTSALPSEGKSTVTRDLARAYADAGERVLLIDCDLRRPSLARMFGVEPKFGLAHILRREASVSAAALTVFRTQAGDAKQTARASDSNGGAVVTGDPRASGLITLITHGERVDSPAALLSSQAMTELLGSAASRFDVVILDTSPVLTVTDAVPLLGQVSAVLFVARLGMTTRESAERLAALGARVEGMNLVGVVVNDLRRGYFDEKYGVYEYGYESGGRGKKAGVE